MAEFLDKSEKIPCEMNVNECTKITSINLHVRKYIHIANFYICVYSIYIYVCAYSNAEYYKKVKPELLLLSIL